MPNDPKEKPERLSAELGFTRSPSDDDPRRDPKLLAAIETIAPGTPIRQAVDDVIRSHEGALIVIGDPARALVPLLGRHPPRRAVPAPAPLRAREDGRSDHRRRGDQAARLGERAADARLDDPVGGDGHPAPHRRARCEADRVRSSSRSRSSARRSRSSSARRGTSSTRSPTSSRRRTRRSARSRPTGSGSSRC